jgi:hypothetical protein
LKDNRNSGLQITPSCAHLGNAGQQQGREQAQKHRDHEQQPNAHPALPLTLALVWIGFATLPFMRLHTGLL